MRRLVAPLLLFVSIVACGGDDEPSPAARPPSFGTLTPGAAEPSPPFGRGEVVLSGDEETTIPVLVAETTDQQQIGLMGQTDLPDDAGMIFLFEGEQQGGFWMKNTLIPLSIAYASADGTIVDILDMEPCEADPCQVYTPSAPYSQALEVNLGAFDDWGIEEGDRLTLSR